MEFIYLLHLTTLDTTGDLLRWALGDLRLTWVLNLNKKKCPRSPSSRILILMATSRYLKDIARLGTQELLKAKYHRIPFNSIFL